MLEIQDRHTPPIKDALIDENLASSIARYIASYLLPLASSGHRGARHGLVKNSVIYICIGPSRAGRIGCIVARMLASSYRVKLFTKVDLEASPIIGDELEVAKELGVKIIRRLYPCDLLIDAYLDGSFTPPLSLEDIEYLAQMRECEARIKLAIDIISGVSASLPLYELDDGGQKRALEGKEDSHKARFLSQLLSVDASIALGSLYQNHLTPLLKDKNGALLLGFVGYDKRLVKDEAKRARDGHLRRLYALEASDLALKKRAKNANKGSYGNLYVVVGENSNAGVISALTALRFGTGKVSVYDNTKSIELISTKSLPKNATAIALGMGLGVSDIDDPSTKIGAHMLELLGASFDGLPLLLDADIFHTSLLAKILEVRREALAPTVLTPHPKEFIALLSNLGLGEVSLGALEADPYYYLGLFCAHYPSIYILLKGSNMLLARGDVCYVNSLASSALAKGGSGDVLSGLIGGLLGQGYDGFGALINASLILALASHALSLRGLSPLPLIDVIASLGERDIALFKECGIEEANITSLGF